jgi:hypothetical protein
MMNSGMLSSKTAIAHTAKELKNRNSPCPTPETLISEKPKKAKFKDQTFILVKK